jgi:2,3-bisphosphoglycerate-dependent phosphoglycerate mutase
MDAQTVKPTVVIAVRHGETEWNRAGRNQGHLDSPLTKRGTQQAGAMAEALSHLAIEMIYSSDLGRAVQTAEIIARRLRLPIHTDARLRERSYGILEGLTLSEFQEKHPAEAAALVSGNPEYTVPKGESARQKFLRNVECVEDLARKHAGATLLVVAHGGALDSFFRRAVQLPLEIRRSFSIFNASVNVFSIADSSWRLETWGEVSHLQTMPTLDDA